jgi:PadR family transcriptional regulator PadR
MPTMQTYDACIVSMKPPSAYLGEFEYAVLLAILQIEDAYAVPIRALLEERTGRPVARGALYTALERLEAKGCLKSRMADPTDERGGKPRRYFNLTPQGLRALKATHGAFANLTRGLEAVLEQR